MTVFASEGLTLVPVSESDRIKIRQEVLRADRNPNPDPKMQEGLINNLIGLMELGSPLDQILKMISGDVSVEQVPSLGGYTGSKNHMYFEIAERIYTDPNPNPLRILDLGAGDAALLKFLIDDSRCGKDTSFFYKAVEKDPTMRAALDELNGQVKKKAPKVGLQQTTPNGADVMNYFRITQDYKQPYDIINAQLLLHYLSPIQICMFLESTWKLLGENVEMFLSIQ